jgi:hypothetical protein
MLYHFDNDHSESEDSKNKKLWNQIKKDICDTFDVILNMRQDYLLKNFFKWFKENLDKFNQLSNAPPEEGTFVDNCIKFLEEDVSKIFPRVINTGIHEIDAVNRDPEDPMFLPGENAHLEGEARKQNRLVETPDFDGLYMPPIKELSGIFFDLMPTFLSVFMASEDIELSHKIMKVLLRLFSQRQELINNISKLNVITNIDD